MVRGRRRDSGVGKLEEVGEEVWVGRMEEDGQYVHAIVG